MQGDLFSVKDQVVLVSGGSRGIGRSIAEGFAVRGARVVITGTNEQTLTTVAQAMERQVEHAIRAMVCDVRELGAIENLVGTIQETVGPIDTLVNVAGINRRKPVLDFSEKDYDDILEINLKGAFWMAREVGRCMVDRGQGSQIHVGSLTTHRPLKHVAPYAMSKSALGQMTRALAMEWGPSGVRVNALAPGFILTDLTRALWSDPAMEAWGKAHTPLGRLGLPADMVGTALFLASPASAFLTGQVLYVDGGFTAGWAWPIPEGGGQ